MRVRKQCFLCRKKIQRNVFNRYITPLLGLRAVSEDLLHASVALLLRDLGARLVCLGILALLDGRLELGVLADVGVGSGVQLLEIGGCLAGLGELREVGGVLVGISLLHGGHVGTDVSTEDALAQRRRIKGVLVTLALTLVETGEAALAVGNIETTINCTLQGTEHTSTSRGSNQTNIKNGGEGAGTLLLLLNVVHLTSDLGDTLISLIQVQGGQQAASAQQTSAVGSGIVLQTERDAIARELRGVGEGKNNITLDRSLNNLADNLLVGESDDEAVLRRVVLVLLLRDHRAAGSVVSLALAAPAVLNLEAAEVRVVLLNFDERLKCMTSDSQFARDKG